MKSVSRTLISVADLPNRQIVVVNADIDGENEAILLYRDNEEIQAYLNIALMPAAAGLRTGQIFDAGRRPVWAAHGATFRPRQWGMCCRALSRCELRSVPVEITKNRCV